jgi:hypothetical protein
MILFHAQTQGHRENFLCHLSSLRSFSLRENIHISFEAALKNFCVFMAKQKLQLKSSLIPTQ